MWTVCIGKTIIAALCSHSCKKKKQKMAVTGPDTGSICVLVVGYRVAFLEEMEVKCLFNSDLACPSSL